MSTHFRVEVDTFPFKVPRSLDWLPGGRLQFLTARDRFIQVCKRIRTDNLPTKQQAEAVKAQCQRLLPDVQLTVTEYGYLRLW